MRGGLSPGRPKLWGVRMLCRFPRWGSRRLAGASLATRPFLLCAPWPRSAGSWRDRSRRRTAPAGCGGHASPGIRGLRPGPGERAAGKGGAVWGVHFRSRDQSLGSGLRGVRRPTRGAQGLRGTAPAPGGRPREMSAREPPTPASDSPPALRGPQGLLPACSFLSPISS